MSQKNIKPKLRFVISGAVFLLVAICGIILLNRSSSSDSRNAASISDSAIYFSSNSGGITELNHLGISVQLSSGLAEKGIIGIPSTNTADSTKTIAFTTKELAANHRACDGENGWIGKMTRYEGSAATMSEHEHAHGSTVFNYPGFHIVYQSVLESCVAKSPKYSPNELAKETEAGKHLWEVMRSAKPL